ncbi:MAG: lysoplasmalogenase [Thermodesulfobacteriota bacterium]
MINALIVLLAATLMPLLLFYEKKGNRKGLLPTKTALSLLFIVAVAVQPHPNRVFFYWLLGGLILCLGGDVCLVFTSRKTFLAGLFFFLMGHVLYIIAFIPIARFGPLGWTGAAVIFIIGACVYLWLRPHLGSMNLPVLAYTIVISIMLSGALAIIGNDGQSPTARLLILLGALSFYASDIFVARDRFMQKEMLNRAVGLPLYYAGQFLLAFSVGLVR